MFGFCLFLSILCFLSFAIYGLFSLIQWYASGKQTDIKKSFPKLKAMLGAGCLIFIFGLTVSESTMKALVDKILVFCIVVCALSALLIYLFPFLFFLGFSPQPHNGEEDSYKLPSRRKERKESSRNLLKASEADVRVSDLNKRYTDKKPN